MTVGVTSVLLGLCLSYLISAHPSPSNKRPLVVDWPSKVTYAGNTTQGVESFLNIKFGQDTGGDNRFAPPVPYFYPPGSTVDAASPGAACPQPKVPVPGVSLFSNVTNISEDCLTLRVDRVAGTQPNENLPVLLWIYGGGDSIGQIYDDAYNPSGLLLGAKAKGVPVIYAAMNYRLGFFGWSAFEQSKNTARPNVGLLDQRLAMEWVRQNIAAFGGDPNNVTIYGESDGGTSVGLHITAYGGSKPAPFKRAILESGSATADSGTNSKRVQIVSQQLTAMLNCSHSGDPDTSIQCLRRLSLDAILPVALAFMADANESGLDVFFPTVDGSFIPEAPSNLLKSGRFSRNIDTIIGWCEDDGAIFAGDPQDFTNSSYLGNFILSQFGGFTTQLVQQTLEQYPADSPPFVAAHKAFPQVPIDWFRSSQIVRDSQYTCPGLLTAQTSAKFNSRDTATYMYTLNSTLYAAFLAADDASFEGVVHTSDIPYIFNEASYFPNVTRQQAELSNRISGSWAQFAANGQVTGKVRNDFVPDWPLAVSQQSYGKDSNLAVRVLGGYQPRVVHANAALSVAEDFEELGRRCAFWNSPKLLAAVQV